VSPFCQRCREREITVPEQGFNKRSNYGQQLLGIATQPL